MGQGWQRRMRERESTHTGVMSISMYGYLRAIKCHATSIIQQIIKLQFIVDRTQTKTTINALPKTRVQKIANGKEKQLQMSQ